eukprot:GHVL01033141.1.p1 GENE.GHVL01033141.1~~GHVL01033141.1.p1  ORF type:complete len:504 (+),score=88.19 GHVL01033141.1:31-1542(+)
MPKITNPFKENGVNKDEVDEHHAILTLPGGIVHKIKILKPTVGEHLFLDIRDLLDKTKYIAFDPGFSSTAACLSAVTYLDGDKGLCTYRGYPVPQLVEHSSHLEVSHLLLYGELPNVAEFEHFISQIKDEMLAPEKIKQFLSGFHTNAHPMAIMCSVTGALASFYDGVNITDGEQRELACIRMIAKMPTIAAMAYKTAIGEPIMYPRKDLTYVENILHMMFATPMASYKVNRLHTKILEAFLIIHADHEQNASTSTVRIAGSSKVSPYACVAAGIISLWGPTHGGANEAVIKMLDQIGSKENVPAFIEKVKDKTTLLMGFGHRVYKNYDPRAKVLQKLCVELVKEQNEHLEMFELAMELERIAITDEYFVQRKLNPNVDFYSGILLKALGIPTSMFTVMFALGRTVGWLSQWKEMVQEKTMFRIARPRQLYVGKGTRNYIPMSIRRDMIDLGGSGPLGGSGEVSGPRPGVSHDSYQPFHKMIAKHVAESGSIFETDGGYGYFE